jgi:hypothetical protein
MEVCRRLGFEVWLGLVGGIAGGKGQRQCFKIRRLFKIWKVVNSSNFQKFGKSQKNSAETKLSCERNSKNLKTRNSAGLIELSAGFSKNSTIFKKMFWPIKKI